MFNNIYIRRWDYAAKKTIVLLPETEKIRNKWGSDKVCKAAQKIDVGIGCGKEQESAELL